MRRLLWLTRQDATNRVLVFSTWKDGLELIRQEQQAVCCATASCNSWWRLMHCAPLRWRTFYRPARALLPPLARPQPRTHRQWPGAPPPAQQQKVRGGSCRVPQRPRRSHGSRRPAWVRLPAARLPACLWRCCGHFAAYMALTGVACPGPSLHPLQVQQGPPASAWRRRLCRRWRQGAPAGAAAAHQAGRQRPQSDRCGHRQRRRGQPGGSCIARTHASPTALRRTHGCSSHTCQHTPCCPLPACLRSPLPAEAQHVVLAEPLLDPAVEAQAVGRVDRIGQQRSTHVHRCASGVWWPVRVSGWAGSWEHACTQACAGPAGSMPTCRCPT